MHLHSCQDSGDEAQCLRDSVQLMLDTDGDVRGTVASIAREIEDFAVDSTFISHFMPHSFSAELYKSQSDSLSAHTQSTRSQESSSNTYSNSTTTPIPALRFSAVLQIQTTSMRTSFSAVQNFTNLLFLMVDESPPQQRSHEPLVLLYRSISTTLVTSAKYSTYSHTNKPKLTTK
jgi:hypothetical protein